MISITIALIIQVSRSPITLIIRADYFISNNLEMSECVFLHCVSLNFLTQVQISRYDELIAVAKQVSESYDKECDSKVKKIPEIQLRQTAKDKTGRKVIESKDIQIEGEPGNNLAVEKRNHINEMTLQR